MLFRSADSCTTTAYGCRRRSIAVTARPGVERPRNRDAFGVDVFELIRLPERESQGRLLEHAREQSRAGAGLWRTGAQLADEPVGGLADEHAPKHEAGQEAERQQQRRGAPDGSEPVDHVRRGAALAQRGAGRSGDRDQCHRGQRRREHTPLQPPPFAHSAHEDDRGDRDQQDAGRRGGEPQQRRDGLGYGRDLQPVGRAGPRQLTKDPPAGSRPESAAAASHAATVAAPRA